MAKLGGFAFIGRIADSVVHYLARNDDVEVYCQSCGTELTRRGGYVMNGGVYCRGKEDHEYDCLEEKLNRCPPEPDENGGVQLDFNFLKGKYLQREIHDGQVTEYGPLERRAEEEPSREPAFHA